MSPRIPSRTPPRTSKILLDRARSYTGERISLRQIEAMMQDRAFGLLVLVLALPNLLPVAIPGMSAVLGLPIFLLAAQLIAGRRTPWLPSWLARRSFASRDFVRFIERTAPWLEKIERVLRPRYTAMTGRPAERFVIGTAFLLLSVSITLPIPLGTWLPALGVVFLALGLLERDGLAVAVGLVLGALGIGLVLGLILGGVELAGFLAEWVPSLWH